MKKKIKMTSEEFGIFAIITLFLFAALAYIFGDRLDVLNRNVTTGSDVSRIVRRNVEDKLWLALRLKEQQCAAYMNNISRALEALAKDTSTVEMLTSLTSLKEQDSSNEGGTEPSSDVHKALRNFESKSLAKFAARNGLADLYAIDNEGYVLFSAADGSELGGRLSEGPLAMAWKPGC